MGLDCERRVGEAEAASPTGGEPGPGAPANSDDLQNGPRPRGDDFPSLPAARFDNEGVREAEDNTLTSDVLVLDEAQKEELAWRIAASLPQGPAPGGPRHGRRG
jgi:hypothetical protein